VVEEERNQTPQTEEPVEEPAAEPPAEPVAETPQDLVEAGETVEAGLEAAPSKGPALDQDEGQIQTDTERNRRKERVGLIVSDKADKTVTVAVEALVRHPMYKKRVRRSKKFIVHDERNEARVGDTVRIIETRPLSARKRWRLANVISRAE
jgi:small subunit ribosomal protein S17